MPVPTITEPVVPQAPETTQVEVPTEIKSYDGLFPQGGVVPTQPATPVPPTEPAPTKTTATPDFTKFLQVQGQPSGQGKATPLGGMGVDSQGRSYFYQNYPDSEAGTFGRMNRVSTVTKKEQERIMLKLRTVDELAFRYPEEFGGLERKRQLFNTPQGVLDDILIQKSMTKVEPRLVYATRPDGSQSTQMELVQVEVPNEEWKVEKSIFERDENGEIVPEQRQDYFYLSLASQGKDREAELYEKLFTIDEAIGEVEAAMEEGFPVNTDFIIKEKRNMIQELITLGYDQTQINQILRQFSTRPELYQGAN